MDLPNYPKQFSLHSYVSSYVHENSRLLLSPTNTPSRKFFRVTILSSKRWRQGDHVNVFSVAKSMNPHLPGPITHLPPRQNIPHGTRTLNAEWSHLVTFSGARQEDPKADTSTKYHPSKFFTADVHKGQFCLQGDIWQGLEGDVFSCHNERGTTDTE